MQFRKIFFVLSTSFTIVLSGPSSSAFTLTQSPGQLESKFELANGTGTTSLIALDPDQPFNLSKSNRFVSEIKRGGTDSFLTTLSTTYNKATGWSFKKGKDLKGSFNVRLQYPCGIKTDCGLGLINPPSEGTSKQNPISKDLGGIGSTISLNYVPLKGSKRQPDPKNSQNLYWIQRVTTNYPYQIGSVDNTISYIDNISYGRNKFTPYYGFGNFIQPNGLFEDRPYRLNNVINLLRDYFWTAELYLAQSNPQKVQEVTIYNGVKWGWEYKYVPDKNKTPVPVPKPTPTPTPFIIPEWNIPIRIPKGEPVASSASGGGGIGYVAVSPSPTPRPIPSPTPRPIPSPTPRPIPSPTPWTSTPWTSTPWTSTPWTSTPWTSTPWVTSPLGSTSSTVVVSTSTTITSSSPLPKPSSPASSPGERPIQAVPLSAISKGNVANLRSSSLFESSSKANTDYLSAISSDLLEDLELSSTDSNLNNAKVAGVSRDLLEDSELSSTDSNQNQVNLADISSNLLEDSELSSRDNNENQVNLAGISSDLLEDPELSSTENDENNADIGSISADLLEDPELSSEDNNSDAVDLAGISADLLEDPELSYLDDTLTAKTQNVSSKNTDDDALSAEAVPEPTTGLGTLFALAILPVIKRFTNRKNK